MRFLKGFLNGVGGKVFIDVAFCGVGKSGGSLEGGGVNLFMAVGGLVEFRLGSFSYSSLSLDKA